MKGVIDRIEGEIAVVELEGRIMKDIYLSVLPEGVKAGDIIIFINNKWQYDEAETNKRRLELQRMMDRMFE